MPPYDIVKVAKNKPGAVLSSFPFGDTGLPGPEGIGIDNMSIPGIKALWSNEFTATSANLRLWEVGGSFIVDGHSLSQNEHRWVLYAAKNIVPQLLGTRDERVRIAAEVSWWGLQQGIFSLPVKKRPLFPNPFVFSLCTELKNGRRTDVDLAPLEECPPFSDPKLGTLLIWQVGLSGNQVLASNRLSEEASRKQQVLDTIQALWPGRTPSDVLSEATQIAELDPMACPPENSAEMR